MVDDPVATPATNAGSAKGAGRSSGPGAVVPRTRMTGAQRREQLINVGRRSFAENGFDAASVEEIAAAAMVSKPVVYEHFGGKEGLYAVVIDREMTALDSMITQSLGGRGARARIEGAAMALLTYVEERTDGFRILAREASLAGEGTYSTLLNDVVGRVTHILAQDFSERGYDVEMADVYAQALVGMVSFTGQWWLDERSPSKEKVAAHVVNLCWNGMSALEANPVLRVDDSTSSRSDAILSQPLDNKKVRGRRKNPPSSSPKNEQE